MFVSGCSVLLVVCGSLFHLRRSVLVVGRSSSVVFCGILIVVGVRNERSKLLVVTCLLFVVCCMLFVFMLHGCCCCLWPLFDAHCWLSACCVLMFVVCCCCCLSLFVVALLLVVCCLLFAVRCL